MPFNPNSVINKILLTFWKKKKKRNGFKCIVKKRNIFKVDFILSKALSAVHYSYFQRRQQNPSKP